MQHHPAVGRRDRERLTDLPGGELHHLAHEEGARGLRRQAVHAALQSLPEGLVLVGALGVSPSRRGGSAQWPSAWNMPRRPPAGPRRPRPRQGCSRSIRRECVDDLVLEDAGEPGPQAEDLPAKPARPWSAASSVSCTASSARSARATAASRSAPDTPRSRSMAAGSGPAGGRGCPWRGSKKSSI